jgi:hypothetical protein
MTSIAPSSNNYLSPLQQLQATLQSEVNSGAISSSDQGALSSALTDINSSLQSGSGNAPASGTNLPPGDLKSKIDTLIAGEVSSGKLTNAQATELRGVFKDAFASGAGAPSETAGPQAAGATHHGHHGGPRTADTTSSTDSTSGSSNTSPAPDILQKFLLSLKNSLSSSSSSPSSYSANGTSASALLIDYQT